MSNLDMRLVRKLPFLLLFASATVVAFFLFLLAANFYYARRAEYLLNRIQALPLDSSSIAELRHLGSEHGFRYAEASDCSNGPCLHFVFTNNGWMQRLLGSPSRAEIGERVGLTSWNAVGDLEIDNGQVVAKIYGLAFYGGSPNLEIEASSLAEKKLDISPCTYYPLERHPGYAFSNASNRRSFRVRVSDAASQQNRANAFQFTLRCLTRRRRCEDFSEIMPAAWADYEEDMRWSETAAPMTDCHITLHFPES